MFLPLSLTGRANATYSEAYRLIIGLGLIELSNMADMKVIQSRNYVLKK